MSIVMPSNTNLDIPFLILHGLDTTNLCRKHLTWFFFLGAIEIHVFSFYLASVFVFYGIQDEDFKVAFMFTFIDILSISLWYSVLKQKKNIIYLIGMLKDQEVALRKSPKKKWRRTINWFVIINCVSPLLLSIFHVYVTFDSSLDCFIYEYTDLDEKLRLILLITGVYAYYVIFMKYPLLNVLSVCVLIHRSGLLLHEYDAKLKLINSSVNTSLIFRGYFKALKVIRLLRNVLQVHLFISLVIGFLSTYVAIEYGLNQHDNYSAGYTVEAIPNVLTGVFILCSVTICSSKIPEYMSAIRETADSLIDQNIFNKCLERNTCLFLKKIAKKNVIYLSALELVNLKRQFLLSAFGALFTYGVLVSTLHAPKVALIADMINDQPLGSVIVVLCELFNPFRTDAR
ncbi:hypothetical protein AVEN_128245-1 [Araneus ventricosus]|uniref:Gustatory receptor n=1 Tax=Araneus ventricosus TaxID=182803 RepID=A0A4Y2A026_ARAVE|nr:hypothetical protein AVEN_128245-1 [Araneus ventricosus]